MHALLLIALLAGPAWTEQEPKITLNGSQKASLGSTVAAIWQGVSVESLSYVDRIRDLCTVPAAVRFLSLEPLLSAISALPLDGVDWVIVGGESGHRARPMKAQWAQEIRDQCVRQSVPFFFKQWGGMRPKAQGRLLDGRTWDEMPVDLGEREEASA